MNLFRKQKAQERQKNGLVDHPGKFVECPECGYAYIDCIGMDKYCSKCGASLEKTSITNFEKIKAMTVDELADFIADIYASNEHIEIRIDGEWMQYEDIEEWLEREVESNE